MSRRTGGQYFKDNFPGLKGYYTLEEVAREYGLTPQYVGKQVRKGALVAAYLGHRINWLVPVKELEIWKAKRAAKAERIRNRKEKERWKVINYLQS